MTALLRKHRFDEVFDSQKVYRLLLKAVSNPLKTVQVGPYADKLYGEYPGMLALAFSLLDNEVTYAAVGSPALSEDIACLTLSRPVPPEDADYLFITDLSTLEETIQGAKCGTLRDPHRSATLVVLTDIPGPCSHSLTGPGIDGTIYIGVSSTVQTALELRDSQCYEYPQGIDFLFLSKDGTLCAVPRLVRREAV